MVLAPEPHTAANQFSAVSALANTWHYRSRLRSNAKDAVIVGILPFFHSFGFTITLWFPLVSGFGVVYHPNPTDAKTIGEIAGAYKATVLISTPTFCSAYVRKCQPEQFAHLRYALVGAEKLREPIADAFREKFGIDLLEVHVRRLILSRDVAVQLHRHVDARSLAVAEDDDRPRGVPVGETSDARRRADGMHLTVGVDDEIEDGRACDGMALFLRMCGRGTAQAHELALERRDRSDMRAPDRLVDRRAPSLYGRRHCRPSRSMSVSASGGPQLPAG